MQTLQYRMKLKNSRNPKDSSYWILLAMICLAIFIYLWGIQKDLPYVPATDEAVYVPRAIRMAAEGDMNPGWFGNPGSTVFYPLTFIYRNYYTITQDGPLTGPSEGLQTHFDANFSEYFLIGRLLSVLYSVMTLPLVFSIGQRLFGTRIGLAGTWMSLFIPVIIAYTKLVRTDTAALFFSILSIWLSIKVYDKPTSKNQLMAGLAIGLSIASRYFMVTLIPTLLMIDVVILRNKKEGQGNRQQLLSAVIGMLAVMVGFVLSTPYFFIDFETARVNIMVEARSTHLGHDGLSAFGNLWWYLTEAIPMAITWPQTVLSGFGVALLLGRRHILGLWIFGYISIFLAAISQSPLHWQRWIIQILPLVTLLAAFALAEICTQVTSKWQKSDRVKNMVLILLVALVTAYPASVAVKMDIRAARPSTRIQAREWIVENLPAHSRILQEFYTAPLGETEYVVYEKESLGVDGSLSAYQAAGYQYLIVSSSWYSRYLAEPERYVSEVQFYHDLFEHGTLLREFEPSELRSGATIRIYGLED